MLLWIEPVRLAVLNIGGSHLDEPRGVSKKATLEGRIGTGMVRCLFEVGIYLHKWLETKPC